MSAKIVKISWKQNANTGGVSAEDAYNAIEEIRSKRGGEVSALDVVTEAKDRKHKLHSIFQWDDKKAAHEHRLEQARSLMRSIEVTYANYEKTPVRAFEVNRTARRGDTANPTTYVTKAEMLSTQEGRDRLLAQAIREAMTFRRKFQELNELRLIFEAIDKAAEQVATA